MQKINKIQHHNLGVGKRRSSVRFFIELHSIFPVIFLRFYFDCKPFVFETKKPYTNKIQKNKENPENTVFLRLGSCDWWTVVKHLIFFFIELHSILSAILYKALLWFKKISHRNWISYDTNEIQKITKIPQN